MFFKKYRNMSQVVEHMSCMHKTLSFTSDTPSSYLTATKCSSGDPEHYQT